MTKLTVEEKTAIESLINQGSKGMVSYFTTDNDVQEIVLSALRRNHTVDMADELKMLHDIATGNVEIIHDFKPGDIVVRVVDWPILNGKDDPHRKGGIFKVKEMIKNGGRTLAKTTDGFKHNPDSLRPATEVEKKFYNAGRKRIEFIFGDVVVTKGGTHRTVGKGGYHPMDALRDLDTGRIDKAFPVENQIKF